MPKFQRILCPIDFSEPSDAAFEYADDLAASAGAELVVLHAFDRPASYDTAGQRVPADASINERLHAVRSRHDNARLMHMAHAGIAEEVICWAAESQNCDMIVMGTHGRSGLKHLLFGSTAEYVVRHARCPVLTVRPQPQDQPPLDEPIISPMPPPRFM